MLIIVQLRSAAHEHEAQGQHHAGHELIGSRLVAVHPVLPPLNLSDRVVEPLREVTIFLEQAPTRGLHLYEVPLHSSTAEVIEDEVADKLCAQPDLAEQWDISGAKAKLVSPEVQVGLKKPLDLQLAGWPVEKPLIC